MELKYYLRGLGLGIAITAIVMGIVSSKNKTMTNEEIIARAKQLGMTENTVLDEINHKDEGQDADKTEDSSKTDADNTDASAQTDADKTGDSAKTDGDKIGTSAKTDAGKTSASAQVDNSKLGSANLPINNDNSNTSQKPDATDNVANEPASGENEASNVPGGNSQSGARKTDSGVDAEAGDTEAKNGSSDTNTNAVSSDTNAKTGSPDTNTNAGSQNNNTKTGSSETKPSGTDTTASDKPMVITVGRGDGSYAVSKKLVDVGAIDSAGDFDTYLCNNGYDKKIRTGTYTIPANASEEQMARIITGAE